MTEGSGRPNVVPDEKILMRFIEMDDPIFSSGEIAETLRISDNAVYRRLKKLENRGLVNSKKVGQGRGWWISEDGRDFLRDAGELTDE